MSDAVLVALIAGGAAVAGSLLNLIAIRSVRRETGELKSHVNGRMDELIRAAEVVARAAGVKEEKDRHP